MNVWARCGQKPAEFTIAKQTALLGSNEIGFTVANQDSPIAVSDVIGGQLGRIGVLDRVL